MYCPRCSSTDRERNVYVYLKTRTNVFSEDVILLHVAPERNLQTVLSSCPNVTYISADLSSSLAMVKMDITEIPFQDSYFDVIICNHVLEHVEDDSKALSELFRVLKAEGWAILQVPISMALDKTFSDPRVVTPEAREAVFGQNDHVRIYAQDYLERLKNTGFSVELYRPSSALDGRAIQYYGLMEKENIYVCHKN